MDWIKKDAPFDENGRQTLGECQGDCHDDEECGQGFRCFERSNGESMPGCIASVFPDKRNGSEQSDFCVKISKPLSHRGKDPNVTLGECEGDCDNDAQCESGLKCHKRSSGGPVPGCADSESSEANGSDKSDYCIREVFTWT